MFQLLARALHRCFPIKQGGKRSCLQHEACSRSEKNCICLPFRAIQRFYVKAPNANFEGGGGLWRSAVPYRERDIQRLGPKAQPTILPTDFLVLSLLPVFLGNIETRGKNQEPRIKKPTRPRCFSCGRCDRRTSLPRVATSPSVSKRWAPSPVPSLRARSRIHPAASSLVREGIFADSFVAPMECLLLLLLRRLRVVKFGGFSVAQLRFSVELRDWSSNSLCLVHFIRFPWGNVDRACPEREGYGYQGSFLSSVGWFCCSECDWGMKSKRSCFYNRWEKSHILLLLRSNFAVIVVCAN